MLKTNSKYARENIRRYIIDHFDPDGYSDTMPYYYTGEPVPYERICADILQTFRSEKYYSESWERAHGWTEQQSFTDWAAGLPSILDTCYYYNRSAVDDLGDILEETAEERNKYSRQDAEKLLTYLIYRELIRNEKRA